MLKSLKLGALSTARGTGLLAATRGSGWRSRRVLILGYHGVATDDEHLWDGELYLTPQLLRSRFEMLRSGGYHVLPLGEALTRLWAGSLPPRAIALTFDDGALDFLTHAVPLLREFQFPATVYLTTYYAAHPWPVFPTMLRYLLWKGESQTLDTTGLTVDGRPQPLATPADRMTAVHRIFEGCYARNATGADKAAILDLCAERLGIDFATLKRRRLLQLMNPAEVASLPQDLVDVQLHTHRHRVPTERELFDREIRENRELISEMTGAASATHFCYPSGVTNPMYVPWLRELGVASATTCFPGLASRASNPWLLPRLIDTSYVSNLEFEGWLTGVSAFLPRRRIVAVPTM